LLPGALGCINESSYTKFELDSSHFRRPVKVPIDRKLAYVAGLAYGDGSAVYGEVRVVTAIEAFKQTLTPIFEDIATTQKCTFRVYSRPGNISDSPQITVALNSTTIRRALFDEKMKPRYDSMRRIAYDPDLAPQFQAGLTDAEGSLIPPEPIEYPHGRVFAIVNSDEVLLKIARRSLTRILRLEPSSVRVRLSSHMGREHTIRGIRIQTKQDSYVLEVCSGARRKWLGSVGTLLRHPDKAPKAALMLATYSPTAA